MATGARMDRTPHSPGLERLTERRKKSAMERFRAAIIRFPPYANLPNCAFNMLMTEICDVIIKSRPTSDRPRMVMDSPDGTGIGG